MHHLGQKYVETYVDPFPMILQSFQNFSGSYNSILFKNLLLYIVPLIYLFVLGRDTVRDICFKETSSFNFSYKLFNNYFSLPQSTLANLEPFRVSLTKSQFRMSVG